MFEFCIMLNKTFICFNLGNYEQLVLLQPQQQKYNNYLVLFLLTDGQNSLKGQMSSCLSNFSSALCMSMLLGINFIGACDCMVCPLDGMLYQLFWSFKACSCVLLGVGCHPITSFLLIITIVIKKKKKPNYIYSKSIITWIAQSFCWKVDISVYD